MMEEPRDKDPLQPIKSASQEVQKIIKDVLKLESEKLYQKKPHINADIINIVKGAVK
jgi:hypothetical protein